MDLGKNLDIFSVKLSPGILLALAFEISASFSDIKFCKKSISFRAYKYPALNLKLLFLPRMLIIFMFHLINPAA